MEAMRERWTDERLDDGFDRVDANVRAARTELATFRVETNKRFDKVEEKVDERFDKVDERFDKFEGKIDKRFDRFEDRFEHWEERFDRWQRLSLSILASLAIGLLVSHL